MTDTSTDKFARRAWLRALERTASIERDPVCLSVHFERLARVRGAAPALIDRDGALGWEDFSARCNRYSRFAHALEPGATAALVMGNCSDYLCVWLGLSRAGIATALINPQLEGDALRHSLNRVRPQLIITDAAHASSLEAVTALLERPAEHWVSGPASSGAAWGAARPLEAALERCSDAPLAPAEERPLPLDATALYIYTSGTTGLPKAARVSHRRVLQWSHWFAGLLDTNNADRMYDCLPLYHSVGGVVATGATLLGGGAVVLAERFSASQFWSDVVEHRCTLFQYIGELCRYLVNAPPHPFEHDHALRIACGNGLRADVWERFQERFRIPRILEYYASTEGNFSLYNCEGEVGAIGRIPPFVAARMPVALVRFDLDRGEPRRNAAGFCERCDTDEVGEALGEISADGSGRFEGYADAQASAAKVLTDVFRSGDRWYRTGDLMRRDARGFFYFVDRIGDTFRWKGENVSTAEVAQALTACRGVREAVVYGVAVPGMEGRAGMAALVTDERFDLDEFRAHLGARLPSYARPVFVRLLPHIASTGTFKPRTVELAHSGFDPGRINDPLFVQEAGGGYVPLDAAGYERILAGGARL